MRSAQHAELVSILCHFCQARSDKDSRWHSSHCQYEDGQKWGCNRGQKHSDRRIIIVCFFQHCCPDTKHCCCWGPTLRFSRSVQIAEASGHRLYAYEMVSGKQRICSAEHCYRLPPYLLQRHDLQHRHYSPATLSEDYLCFGCYC
jgi:hypothetical protein